MSKVSKLAAPSCACAADFEVGIKAVTEVKTSVPVVRDSSHEDTSPGNIPSTNSLIVQLQQNDLV